MTNTNLDNVTEAMSETSEAVDEEVHTIKDYDALLNPFWTVLFSGSIITGTLGNLIVLWIVIGKKILSEYSTVQFEFRAK